MQIVLDQARRVAGSAMLVSLNASNPEATNTITAPTRIVPVRRVIKQTGKSFVHVVPPYSIEVIELNAVKQN